MGPNRSGARRGTTLAELLVAVVMLAVAASVLLRSATTAQDRATYSKRRAVILAYLRDQIATAQSLAYQGVLVPGTQTTTLPVQGLEGTVTVTASSSLVSGYTSLFLVSATATWTEVTPSGSRPDTMTLQTYVRQPDA